MSKYKPKLLIVNKYFSPVIGGIETHVKDIADGLCGDFDVRVLVCNTDKSYKVESYPSTLLGTGKVHKVGAYKVYKIKSFGKYFSMPVSLEYFKYFRELSVGADIIHFHHPFPLGELACLKAKPSAKIIVTWHSDILRQKFFMQFYKPYLRNFLHRADKIIVTSSNMAKYSPYLQDFQEKIEIIPLGIDTSELKVHQVNKVHKVKEKYSNTKLLILSVGRLSYYKGYEYLIEAMKNVDANLLIIGSGPLEKKLKIQSSKLKVNEKIHFINPVSDEKLADFYQSCDIFVLPSIAKTEAFGIVQLEAMAAGKPVINTNLPTGVPWVSVNNETGLTVPPEDSNALASAINKLIINPKLLEKFGRNARIRVEELFSKEKMISSYSKIFRGIHEKKTQKSK